MRYYLLVFIVLSIFFIASFVQSQSSTLNDPIEIHWSIAHYPEHYFLKAATKFKEIVEERSGGELTVRITSIPDSDTEDTRYDVRDQAEDMLRNGEVTMMQMYTSALIKDNPNLEVLDVPLLFKNYEHIDAVVDGPIGKQLLGGIDSEELKGLAFTFSGGYMAFITSDKEIKNLADLFGQKIKHRSGRSLNILTSQLGLIPVLKYNSEGRQFYSYEYFEKGLSNVLELNYADVLYYLDNTERIQSLINSKHRVLFTTLVINKQFYEELTDEQKGIVKFAAQEAAKAEREAVRIDDEKVFSSGKYDNLIHNLGPEDKEKLERIASIVEEEISDSIDENLLSSIKNIK